MTIPRFCLLGGVALATVLAAGCGVVTESSKAQEAAAPEAWQQPVPRPACGPEDDTESNLQGQVPAQDRMTGRSLQGYNCNLELAAQHAGEGSGISFAWYEDCAYMAAAGNNGFVNNPTPRPTQTNPGVQVIDVADPANPTLVGTIDSQSMLDPWESLKTNEPRALLAAVDSKGGGGSPQFDIYDISGPCNEPKMMATVPMGSANGHAGNFAPDGLTYYAGGSGTGKPRAIDVSNPAAPVLLAEGDDFAYGTHDLAISDDGNRVYLAYGPTSGDNGLVILDSSSIQQRRAPEVSVISTFFWTDGHIAQLGVPITIGGKPFILINDENGSTFPAANGGDVSSCVNNLPPFGFARLIDISDETAPQLTAKIMLEVNDPANCPEIIADTKAATILAYDSHYCWVDDLHNATAAACGWLESGIRVFDIRDPYRPKEIAYYIPPGNPSYQANSSANFNGACLTIDRAPTRPRFIRERGELWVTTSCNGFQVLKFTNGAWPFAS
jgi:hypothetical protein